MLSTAYINNSNKDPKPLMRAWMCHGRTHREMIEKLASVSVYYFIRQCCESFPGIVVYDSEDFACSDSFNFDVMN